MLLQSLELSGFKSFAKRTVLTFDEGITAVVGPNGSGKSNIADAVRWVLGAQSKKAVRGKVSSDVIFSGSGAKPPMSLAEVSLTLDNGDHKLPYDYDQVVVTRRLYRSGDSDYLVNGAKVRLVDLQHAFAVAGLGAEHYTVISQGMVDQVLTQTPTQRRSLFEEAAGVRQFYLKRDEARRKLSETTTNLGRIEDILRELKPRLRLLRRQAQALTKREELERQLHDAYRAQYGHRYRKLAAERRTLRAKQQELNREFAAMKTELDELTKQIDDQRQRAQGLKLNRLLSEKGKLQDQRDRLQRKLADAVTAKEVARATLSRAAGQRQQLTERLVAIGGPAKSSSPPTGNFNRKLRVATTKLETITAEYETVQQWLKPGDSGTDQSLSALSGKLSQVTAALRQAIAGKKSYDELLKLLGMLEQHTTALGRLAAQEMSGDDTAAQLQSLLKRRDEAIKQVENLRLRQAAVDEAAKLQESLDRQTEQERAVIIKQRRVLDDDVVQAKQTIATSHTELASSAEILTKLDQALEKLAKAISVEEQRRDGLAAMAEQEKALVTKRRTFEAYREELSELNLGLAKVETRLDDLVTEAKTKLGDAFPPSDDEELPAALPGEERPITRLEKRLQELGGIDPAIIAEHQEVEERYTSLNEQAEDLQKARADLEQIIRQLERQSRTIFREAFAKINEEFSHYFTKLFGGGKAVLRLIDEAVEPEDADPEAAREKLEAGIGIKAIPPGKRLGNLGMLSGGERALTSVALLFAILKVNPSPFVLLDEVDAALDEANSDRFADLLKELAQQTQFIVVTHNRETMKQAKMLYGVTMDETGISTLLSIKLAEAEKVVAR